jgi:hypothetical protein
MDSLGGPDGCRMCALDVVALFGSIGWVENWLDPLLDLFLRGHNKY